MLKTCIALCITSLAVAWAATSPRPPIVADPTSAAHADCCAARTPAAPKDCAKRVVIADAADSARMERDCCAGRASGTVASVAGQQCGADECCLIACCDGDPCCEVASCCDECAFCCDECVVCCDECVLCCGECFWCCDDTMDCCDACEACCDDCCDVSCCLIECEPCADCPGRACVACCGDCPETGNCDGCVCCMFCEGCDDCPEPADGCDRPCGAACGPPGAARCCD